MTSPWTIVLAITLAAGLAGPVGAQTVPGESDREAWVRARGSSDVDVLRAFIARFPDSSFVDVARGRIELIDRQRLLDEREREVQRTLDEERTREAAAHEAAERERVAAERLERERIEQQRQADLAAERRLEELRRKAEATQRQAERKVRLDAERERLARERVERRRVLAESAVRTRLDSERKKADAARRRAERELKRVENELAARGKLDRSQPRRSRLDGVDETSGGRPAASEPAAATKPSPAVPRAPQQGVPHGPKPQLG
jgi:membrane protein involved in colicin uptake